MKLQEQKYQILDRWKIEIIWHKELLWEAKQIIRLKKDFFDNVKSTLDSWKDVSLYNHYNPINIDLIRDYINDRNNYNQAMISKIIDSNEKWPILEFESLQKVEVIKMQNINFEDIKDEDLIKSIAYFKREVWLYELLNWLSTEFYQDKSIEDIQKEQKLFFRQITLK